MPTPTVPFKMLAKGYRVRGGQDGLQATVTCLVDWTNAFVFHDQVLGFPYAPTVGTIVYTLPWQFPGAPLAKMYAITCEIEPVGINGEPLSGTYGMSPGEFFQKAFCTVEFKNRAFLQAPSDDPGGLNQLDPTNPIAFCDQEISGGAKMVTRKGLGYLYDDGSSKPVIGDFGVVEPECKLSLTFPWLPFQPWQTIQSLVGSVNLFPLLGCAKGTILFEEFSTKAQATTQGLMGTQLRYGLSWQPDEWNKLPNASGTPTLVKRNDGSGLRIYPYQDLSALLNFS